MGLGCGCGGGLSAYMHTVLCGTPDSVPDSLLQSRSLPWASSVTACNSRHITVKLRSVPPPGHFGLHFLVTLLLLSTLVASTHVSYLSHIHYASTH